LCPPTPHPPLHAVIGASFAASAYYIGAGQQARGFRLAFFNSLLLTGVMGHRLWKTGKAMPAAPLTLLGAGSGAYHFLKWQEWAEE
jgi:uncharacterized membrane protein (UPF0136 family)